MTTWRVDATVVHPRFGEFVILSSWEDQLVLNNCQVDVSDRTVDLHVYVSGGSKDQAIHRAGRVFHTIVRGINLSGDSVIAQIPDEPVEVPAEEADPEITVDCPDDEKESTANILLVNRVMDRAAPPVAEEDVTKWTELYEKADEKNRRRVKDLIRGTFLLPFDKEMANFYGYKVLDTMLDDEFSHLNEKNRFSRGKASYHVQGLRGAFDRVEDSDRDDIEEALDTLEEHLPVLTSFPKDELLHRMAEETGFYEEVKDNKRSSIKSTLLRQKAREDTTVIAAYRGDEYAIQALKSSDSRDYDALMEKIAEIEREAAAEADELAEEHVEAWEERFKQAQKTRGDRIAHGLLSENPDETAELRTEFNGLIALGKHLVKESIRGNI